MNDFMAFLAGFVSWNALVWLIIAGTTVMAARLKPRCFTDCDGHELGALVHFVAMTIAGIILVVGCLMGFATQTENISWFDLVTVQFTAQSLLINGIALLVHFLFIVERSRHA